MNKEDFRIKEYDSKFTIEKRKYVNFFKRPINQLNKKYEWALFDDGLRIQYRIIMGFGVVGGYDSLQKAENRLKEILKQPIYHYLK